MTQPSNRRAKTSPEKKKCSYTPINLDAAPQEDLELLLNPSSLRPKPGETYQDYMQRLRAIRPHRGQKAYARLLLRARRARLAGAIATAQSYEDRLELVYARLPSYLRW